MASSGEWFEEEAFWDMFAPVMFGAERWAEVPSVADGVQSLSGFGPIGGQVPATRVVDLCCGSGRIAVELAVRGYRVSGVDITATYLEAARESALDEGVDLELVHADVRQFVRPARYDLALNLYISFGYFDDPDDDLLFAKNAHASLVPGGVFIIETLGRELAIRDFTPGETFERGGWNVTTSFESVDFWAGLRNHWTVTRGDERFERSFVQRLYSAADLSALLLKAGFGSVEFYGEWDKSPYDEKARVLIAVARK